ncbi:unnamed protein product [Angiostrongylus costaricensis]|uniref:Ovule protein n=1 Tax=Angiostrongylus costaricensis TaxID=334426 RepID=A0A0R3PJ59_ANGCS|nr:unnamed protein product [Angiostrongylus costaricensis]
MRVCILRQLLERCGIEAMKAFNTSISLGYLRTERRERLNLDFEVRLSLLSSNCVYYFSLFLNLNAHQHIHSFFIPFSRFLQSSCKLRPR